MEVGNGGADAEEKTQNSRLVHVGQFRTTMIQLGLQCATTAVVKENEQEKMSMRK